MKSTIRFQTSFNWKIYTEKYDTKYFRFKNRNTNYDGRIPFHIQDKKKLIGTALKCQNNK